VTDNKGLGGCLLYSHSCLKCGDGWNSSEEQQSRPVCRQCYKILAECDEPLSKLYLIEITSKARENLTKSYERLKSLNIALREAEAREGRPVQRFLKRFTRNDPLAQLSRDIDYAQQTVADATHRLHLCGKLPDRVKATRVRYKSKQMILAQHGQSKARAELHKQGQRASEFQNILNELKLDRDLFLIRKTDYKRGNLLDNFIRSKWKQTIHEAFTGQCFVCAAGSDLTIDHLWLPKNEGGNFVMCVGENALLSSNVLLLCRSCNSAKGEAGVEQFFSPHQMLELAKIQKVLSRRMMDDPELRKIAGKWYGKVIDCLVLSDP
jgi:5-methylcytosine-specific restriction endonuclease McrA